MNTTFLKAVIILSVMWGLAFHFSPSGKAGEVETGDAVVVNPGQANTKTETLLPIPVTGKQKGSDDDQTASIKETVFMNKSQEQGCEVLGGQLRDALRNVKYFTVRGDECSIVKNAEAFLKLKDQCQEDCPETFFEDRGYNPDIVRNVHTLLGLGRKRCLGESSGQSSMKKDK